MKLRNSILVFMVLLSAGYVHGQETSSEFKPNGQPIIKIYTNFHSTFTGGEDTKAFEIRRAYLGYQYHLNEKISGRLILDVGDPNFGDLDMTAYLKNAFVQYASGKLIAQIGMISLQQYKMQEGLWGGRYLYKSFMDEHNIGPSADLGAFLSYQVHKIFSVDLAITNGNGYKSIENDSVFKYSLGMTVTPIRGMDVRVFYDYMGENSPQQTLAFYVGYSFENFKIGGEYILQPDHEMVESHDLTGYSFYGSYQLKRTRFFGRYDNLSSKIIDGFTEPWNYGDDGQLIIAGVEFNPVKGLMVTPNYQGWIPADGSPISNSVYLSLEISF